MHLCLQCIRKFTTEDYELIVIDNGSGDHPSLDYLKDIDWIKLIVRDPSKIDPEVHAAADVRNTAPQEK